MEDECPGPGVGIEIQKCRQSFIREGANYRRIRIEGSVSHRYSIEMRRVSTLLNKDASRRNGSYCLREARRMAMMTVWAGLRAHLPVNRDWYISIIYGSSEQLDPVSRCLIHDDILQRPHGIDGIKAP